MCGHLFCSIEQLGTVCCPSRANKTKAERREIVPVHSWACGRAIAAIQEIYRALWGSVTEVDPSSKHIDVKFSVGVSSSQTSNSTEGLQRAAEVPLACRRRRLHL